MPTFTALTTLPDEAQANMLGAAVEDLDPSPTGVGVFLVEDGSGFWEVGAYFTEAPDEIGLSLLAAAHGARPFAVSELPETDWVAKVRRELSPVEAGRFYLYGSHDAETVPADRIGLLIEAAMAFGTGHHGTTQGCLIAFDTLLTEGVLPYSIADIGCGTAVLAMAAAKSLPEQDRNILASDIDQVAVDVAEANLAANGVSDRVRCLVAEGFDHPDLKAPQFDLIFANILKGPLVDLAPNVAERLKIGGFAILSGLLNEQSDQIISTYREVGVDLYRKLEVGEWTTLVLLRN